MTLALDVVRTGSGPRVLLIHGSATDHASWSIQLMSPLADRFTLIAYDRRISESVREHADDVFAVLGEDPAPAIIVGQSFGAVVALDAVRRAPARFAGAVFIEPPLPPDDGEMPRVILDLVQAFERELVERGGPAAAELFLRAAIGDAAFERMPPTFRDRMTATWRQIQADWRALLAYQPRYDELRSLDVPVQLLGGETSASFFRSTLDALFSTFPDARLEIVPAAGHMLHAEAPRRFAAILTAFANDVLQ